VFFLQDVALSILGYLEASALLTLAQCCCCCRGAAGSDRAWRLVCERLWSARQQSVMMRCWLAEPHGQGVDPGVEAKEERVWRDRYIAALKDSRRCLITHEELCEDTSVDPATGRPFPRRWHLRVYLDRWQDKEVVFPLNGGDGSAFHVSVLQWKLFDEVPWRPFRGEASQLDLLDPGEVEEAGFTAILVPTLPFPLNVTRTEDWGWFLSPAAEQVMELTSRQLSVRGHINARRATSELFTLYLQASSRRCGESGLGGSWEVVHGFQGTMPARTWAGLVVEFKCSNPRSGICSMTFPSDDMGFQPALLFHFSASSLVAAEPGGAEDEELSIDGCREGLLELYQGSTPMQLVKWLRGAPAEPGTLPPLVLIIDASLPYRGVWPTRPEGIPEGLPSLDDVASAVRADSLPPILQVDPRLSGFVEHGVRPPTPG